MKSLKIILLFDLYEKLTPQDYEERWLTLDWKSENDVKKALQKLGHTVVPFGLYNEIEPFIQLVKDEKPDLIFNMSESYNGDRHNEPHVAALMKLVGVPFTGAGSRSLQICKDKGLTKIILSHHNIKTPEFIIAQRNNSDVKLDKVPFPVFIKPLELESSEGISYASYAKTPEEALARISFIHNRLGADALVEEFIDGREVYVSLLGNEKLSVFPPRELFFKNKAKNEPKFATYKSKWDQEYRKKWGIDSGWAQTFPEPIQKKLNETCKRIYKLLGIQGFGRIDLRIKDDEIYFIEANPNPSIAKKEDYALSAKKAGIEYEELIAKIVALSLGA